MNPEVTGIDHIYVTVRDLVRSERYYDSVMAVLGFRKTKRPLASGDLHIHTTPPSSRIQTASAWR
jgi:catechol 2,3-dioxygenase-like lactoylglutathione lyase family enzyme